MTAFDLDAYLARIGYDGPREPTLGLLGALQLAHTRAIPFENLSPLLGLPVPIDISSLVTKLVRGRRGGYCFEHNRLFHAVLTAIGFSATSFGARVYLDRTDSRIPSRTHLAVRVDLDGVAYLADVGFGGQSPTGPLRLDTEAAQDTPHEPYRIVASADRPDHEDRSLEAQVAGQWKLLYRFTLTEPPEIDMVVANHYVASHPDSPFRNVLMVARTEAEGRHTLLNDRMSFHHLGGRTEKRTLNDADALIAALQETFGIAAPDERKLAAIFETLKAS